jgi:hypothetical protein
MKIGPLLFCVLQIPPTLRLVAKGPTKALDAAAKAGTFQGISVSSRLKITHLLFVDDILIFCNGKVGDVETLADILATFRLATYMIINEQKFTIFTSELDEKENEVYQTLPFHYARYLTRNKIQGLSTKIK